MNCTSPLTPSPLAVASHSAAVSPEPLIRLGAGKHQRLNTLPDCRAFAADSGKESPGMSMLPRWTTGISERVMDATALVMDAADEDGKRTAREEAALAALRDVQRAITETDKQITSVDRNVSDLLSVMRHGQLAESRKRRPAALNAD